MTIRYIGRIGGGILRQVRVVTEGNYERRIPSRQFTLALVPRLWQVVRECDGFIVVALGIRFHYRVSYGGRFAA